jgi:hypothetical protein
LGRAALPRHGGSHKTLFRWLPKRLPDTSAHDLRFPAEIASDAGDQASATELAALGWRGSAPLRTSALGHRAHKRGTYSPRSSRQRMNDFDAGHSCASRL